VAAPELTLSDVTATALIIAAATRRVKLALPTVPSLHKRPALCAKCQAPVSGGLKFVHRRIS
jgi:hypothetical protein